MLLCATEMLVNFVSLFSQCESPEEFYCYLVELSMISSIALATQETKNSWFVVVILHYAGNQWLELCRYLQETAE